MGYLALDDREFKIAIIGSGLDALPFVFNRHERLPVAPYPAGPRAAVLDHALRDTAASFDGSVSAAPAGEKKRISSSPRARALSSA